MRAADLPFDEPERLADLHALRILDAGPEDRFDRITRLAQRTFGTPMVAFSLVDADRQYFKSRIGIGVESTPREHAFCAHTILQADVMVVPDACEDPRFDDNPLVTGDPRIRFYAGAPVHAQSGRTLGTICVLDTETRDWSPRDSAMLADLAVLVEKELGDARVAARHEALVALTTISALPDHDHLQQLQLAMAVAADYLGVPHGVLVERLATSARVVVSADASDDAVGRTWDLPSPADLSFTERGSVHAVSRLSGSALSGHPILAAESVEAVIGTAIEVEGTPFGALVFTSPEPLPYGDFTSDETDFVLLLARWVEGVLTRARQQEAIARRRTLLSLIRRVQSEFIASADRELAFELLLKDILALTGCAYGFVAERLLTDDGQPYLRTRAISNIAWNEETRAMYERDHSHGLVFDNPHTLFGVPMTTGQPLVTNDPSSDPRRGGNPSGHPPLDSFAGIPLHQGDEFVGMIGLANHPGGFDDDFVEFVEPLAITVAQLISAVRAQEQHRKDQGALARLSAVVQQMGTGALITDLDARIEWANSAIGGLLGYQPEELIGLRPRDVFHGPGTDRETERAVREAMENRESFMAELLVVHRTGRRMWVAVDSTLLRDDAGEPRGYAVLVDDISERKRVERMKGEFVSTISHELRTPLTSISGSLALVASGAVGELPTRAARMVEIAQQNSARLTELIDDLLELDRLVEGGVPIEVEPHPVTALIHTAVTENQGYAAKHGATIVLGEAADDAIVEVDSLRFVQVMSNLLSNASKFSPDGGVITVDALVRDGHVQVEVTDQGPGVPDEFRGRLFEKFAQADGSDSRARGGTGLGLAISKELIERMQGTIGHRPAESGGSTFWFRLPLTHDRRSGTDRRERRR